MSSVPQTRTDAEPDGHLPEPAQTMSEEEFVAWCVGDTWAEWVDGKAIRMSPVSFPHERLFMFLVHLLRGFVEDRDLGILLTEPFQVRLGALRRRRSPDIFFLATDRMDIIQNDHVDGPPDLIIEIVSRESQARDWREKYGEYEAAGVREYWVIDPMSHHMEAYTLGERKQFTRIEENQGAIPSGVLPGFHVQTAWLWQDPLPKVADLLRGLGGGE